MGFILGMMLDTYILTGTYVPANHNIIIYSYLLMPTYVLNMVVTYPPIQHWQRIFL